MREYRLYCLGGDGRFIKSKEITATDDNDALAQARGMKLGVNCELSERGRLVAEIVAHAA
jgi:antitoxin (DNA-binding transcriptional repressor) of toxin-antitoxin stability system